MSFTTRLSLRSLVGLALGFGLILSGCATSPRRTESMLAASGFKVIPVTTPEQQKQLATLPSGKISVIKRQGKVFFVYPDSNQKQLYVGQDAQYDAYQNLLLNREAMQESIAASQAASNAAALNAEANIVSSEPWGFYDPWVVFGPWYP